MQVSERPLGVFSRQLFLGDTLDTDRIRADYDAGVLTLRIPIAEKAKPRRIEIIGQPPNARKSRPDGPFLPAERQVMPSTLCLINAVPDQRGGAVPLTAPPHVSPKGLPTRDRIDRLPDRPPAPRPARPA